ncbi:SAM-dependent methyltransferase [Actinoplanes rectilineatus]|uniref:SAM-dependent methyltransferase n=1 Tax=Actinoplanes rectilineatus TaxID=113571 RepID=UPI0005F2E915|nr:SAM-dependent methyltransferase [Actinoplanes rectilineatus]
MSDPLDTGRPHPARVYDYLLGGKDHFAADRAAAEQGLQANPNAATAPRQNRAFLRRTVRMLAEAGVDQFLDIGTGLPTSPNVHEVAQEVLPAARVVYVDYDPLVLAHARALLTSTPEGRTGYAEARLQDGVAILERPEVREILDLDRPVALLLYAVLHFVDDADDPYATVAALMGALPRGSHLVISHITDEHDPQSWARFAAIMRGQGITTRLRDRLDVARFFTGLDLLEPGVTPILRWRPDEVSTFTDAQVALFGGVGRKR